MDGLSSTSTSAKWYEPFVKQAAEDFRKNLDELKKRKQQLDKEDKLIQEKRKKSQLLQAHLYSQKKQLLVVDDKNEKFTSSLECLGEKILSVQSKSEFVETTLKMYYERYQYAVGEFNKLQAVIASEISVNDEYTEYLKNTKTFITSFVGAHKNLYEKVLSDVNSDVDQLKSKCETILTGSVKKENEIKEIVSQRSTLELESQGLLGNIPALNEEINALQNQLLIAKAEEGQASETALKLEDIDARTAKVKDEIKEMTNDISLIHERVQADEDESKEYERRVERSCAERNNLWEALKKKEKVLEDIADSEFLCAVESGLTVDQINDKLENLRKCNRDLQDHLASLASHIESYRNQKEIFLSQLAGLEQSSKNLASQVRAKEEEIEKAQETVLIARKQYDCIKEEILQTSLNVESTEMGNDDSELIELKKTLDELVVALGNEEYKMQEQQSKADERKKILESLNDLVSQREVDNLRLQLEALEKESSALPDMICQKMEEATVVAEKLTRIANIKQSLQSHRTELEAQKRNAELERQRQFEETKREGEKSLENLKAELKRLCNEEELGKLTIRNSKLTIKELRNEREANLDASASLRSVSSELFQIQPALNNLLAEMTLKNDPAPSSPHFDFATPAAHARNLFDYGVGSSEEWAVSKKKNTLSDEAQISNKNSIEKPPSRPESPTSTVFSGDEKDINTFFKPKKTYSGRKKTVKNSAAPKASSSTSSSIEILIPSPKVSVNCQKMPKTFSRKDIFLGGVMTRIDSINPIAVSSTPKLTQNPDKTVLKDPYAFDSSSEDNPFTRPIPFITTNASPDIGNRWDFSNTLLRPAKPDHGDSSDNIVPGTPPRSVTKKRLLGPSDDAVFASQSDGETENGPASEVSKLTIKSQFYKLDRKRRRVDPKKAAKGKKTGKPSK